MAIVEMVGQSFDERGLRIFGNTQGSGDNLRHEVFIGERGEFNQPDAMFKVIDQVGANLKGETSFTGPARPRKRDQGMLFDQAVEIFDLLLATDEAGDLDGQVVGASVEGF